ncbi:TrbG/VirB9 family P-type conjugative transfer protein [Sphingomonas sp. RHCKR7]|uniref:TrbG/VirB9 family P-type conjugative transfer protein n=1 Tax=Sphingomonas folli TaxID=2862497 RepID=UPI001C66895D|nr:TrbG/VirB9 family P-type conjugative transfer protein [Sphingomonas folli]MBW6528694.1 TrbG/VirB9 family P-type conjugative transfer protein [Sphingomonas folli]
MVRRPAIVGRVGALLCGALLAALAAPGTAQVGDSRIQSIPYRDDQVVRVRAAPGYEVTIELASDERIVDVALGDGTAWQVTANKAGNLLFVKPLQLNAPTDMAVATDVRRYQFELVGVAEPGGDLPFAIRFRYPAMAGTDAPSGPSPAGAGAMIADYRLSGSRALYPAAISDDGARTFIDWPADGPLPAVYRRERGTETLLNGNMRGRFFVLDEVVRELVFRLDRQSAHAERLPPAPAPAPAPSGPLRRGDDRHPAAR